MLRTRPKSTWRRATRWVLSAAVMAASVPTEVGHCQGLRPLCGTLSRIVESTEVVSAERVSVLSGRRLDDRCREGPEYGAGESGNRDEEYVLPIGDAGDAEGEESSRVGRRGERRRQ